MGGKLKCRRLKLRIGILSNLSLELVVVKNQCQNPREYGSKSESNGSQDWTKNNVSKRTILWSRRIFFFPSSYTPRLEQVTCIRS